MTYLCQEHHDLGATSEKLSENILNGLYVLHDFASNMWLKLVENYLAECGTKAPPSRLTKALESLRNVRENVDYSSETGSNNSLLISGLRVSLPADIKSFLFQADEFRRISAASEHRVDQGMKVYGSS